MRNPLTILLLLGVTTLLSAHPSLPSAINKASEEQKNIFVSFGSDWCLPCQIMKEDVFSNAEINHILNQDYILIEADYDIESDQEWFQKYSVGCLPTIVIADPDGNEIERWEHSMGVTQMLKILNTYKVNRPTQNIAYSPTEVVKENINPVQEKSIDLTEKEIVHRVASHSAVVNETINPVQVQFGAFSVKNNAESMMHTIKNMDIDTVNLKNDGRLYKVIAYFSTSQEAKVAMHLSKENGIDCFQIGE